MQLRIYSVITALLAATSLVRSIPTKRASSGMFGNSKFVPPPAVSGPRWNATAHSPVSQGVQASAMTAPFWVVYNDQWVSGENGPPITTAINGFNVFIMSFLLAGGPADQAVEWVQIGDAARSAIKAAYAAAGVKLMVSVFGATDAPTSGNYDPVALANTVAAWVKQYGLDGVDVDYEDFNAVNAQDGKAEAWLISFTKQLRYQLPAGQYLLTHAPVAPWFSTAKYKTGAYAAVNAAVGNLIDWYNVQFYNQGTNEYTTCSGLLTASSSTWPNTAVFQLAASGVALNKIVIGKPATSGDADSGGYMSPATLATCVQQAKSQGWSAGVMSWEFPHANAAWITTVRSLSWPAAPVTSTATTTTKTSTTTTKTTTTTKPTGTSCGTVSAWSATTTYVGGDRATYAKHLWTAKWWTLGDIPGTDTSDAPPWQDDGAC